jgi:uncharacterized protein (TIGR00251 family)
LIEVTEKNGAVTFKIRAQPRAAKSEIVGEYNGALKVRIAAPPVDGKANDECKKFFSKLFCLSSSDVEIVAGDSSRDKIIRLHDITANCVLAVLNNTKK